MSAKGKCSNKEVNYKQNETGGKDWLHTRESGQGDPLS